MARLLESPTLGLIHLDLAVELTGLTPTRGCWDGCRGWASSVPTGLVATGGWQGCAAHGQHHKSLLGHV